MSEQLVKRIIKELFPYVSNILFGSAGEPLLSPHMKPILREIARYPFCFVSVVTNGTCIDDEYIDLMVGTPLNQITVSIDTPRPELLASIRRGLDARKLMKNIERLAQARAKAAVGPKLCFNAVVTRYNMDHLSELAQYAVDVGFHFLGINTIWGLIQGSERTDSDPLFIKTEDTALVKDQVLKAADIMAANNLGFSFSTDRTDIGVPLAMKAGNEWAGFPPARLADKGVDWSKTSAFPSLQPIPICSAPWKYAVIQANGDISLCCYSVGKAIANISNKPFRTAWNSHQFKKIRRSLGRRKIHSLCYNKPCYFLPQSPKISLQDSFNHQCLKGNIEFIKNETYPDGPKAGIAYVRIRNTGDAIWRSTNLHGLGAGRVNVAVRFYAQGEPAPDFDRIHRTPLHADLLPGDELDVMIQPPADIAPGTYILEATLVSELMFWFHERDPAMKIARREWIVRT